ncbi:TraK family protein [Paraburkholderia bonniea]|uniref:TraK family protein n=1 Tax=Paraburkholderia bonniea TaxID=2152891 RepID=UPI002572F67A|nr:TraK family protein [Paraburkholderia bonniea]WJF90212.1 TraK family protein [Paraburkholderia bonniea]WJF93526.1 TraK family protein [Paraburkholderia bonniea]
MAIEPAGDDEMTTSFPVELAAWVAQRSQTAKIKRKESLAAFLAVRADVIEATAAGYALKTIWEHMRETGRVSFRYETFLKYVRRHITNAPAEPVAPTSLEQGNGQVATISGPKKREVPSIGGFSFNPTSDKKDLF